MLIRDFSRAELTRRLRSDGIHLITGAFTIHVRATIPDFAAEFVDMYEDFPVEDSPGIDDSQVLLGPSSLVRRYFGRRAKTWISGSPAFGPVPVERAFTAFEASLNWSTALNDVAPIFLHAAVLERDGRALILPAESGSGKSTLCAALAWRGWRLFSDEMAIFGSEDGNLRPNPRPVSLKNRAVDVIAAFEPDAHMSRTYRGTVKGDIAYMRPPADAVARSRESATPGLVVAPKFAEGVPTTLERLDKTAAFRLLTENAVNYTSMLHSGFERLTGVVEQCDAYRITYSDLESAVEVIDRLHRESVGSHTAL